MFSRNKSVITQKVEGETILQNTDTGTIHLLNTTSSIIWDMCDGEHDQNDITSYFIQKYPSINPAEIINDIDFILQQFQEAELIIT